MTLMNNFNPYFTNDGSVGLYSQDFDDVYHSTYGALTEAYEKFILPADFKKYFQKNNEIKILDLCFGIGYNTKSFLNYLIENLNIDTIGTDNIIYNDKIYTNNKKLKIYIHAIEKDKNLVQLCPFIKTYAKLPNKNFLPFKHEKISKMLSEKIEPKYKLNPQINYLLLEKLKNVINDDINNILYNKKYARYFDRAVIDFNSLKNPSKDILYPLKYLNAFLHNIYYRYISKSHKKAFKALKLLDFNFDINTDDARTILKRDKNKYNFVFLDAFTPTKCPCLWSLEFFKLLYKHLEDNGMILTYSNSAQVRHAMIEAGFDIYKNMIDGKSQGTIAVKNKDIYPRPLREREEFQNEERVLEIRVRDYAGEGANIDKIFSPASEDKSNNKKFINADKILCSKLPPPFEGEGWGEGAKIEPLSQYDLGLLKTKAGIFYRDENLNLTNEDIIARHDLEVKNSNLISASKYKRENML